MEGKYVFSKNIILGFRSLQDWFSLPPILDVLYHLPQVTNVEDDEKTFHQIYLQLCFVFCVSL